MKPTIEDLQEAIYSSVSCVRHAQVKGLAEHIMGMFTPKYKPLSSIINSTRDCSKIFSFFMGESMKKCDRGVDVTIMDGDGSNLYLRDDGSYSYWGDPKKKPTCFELTDFLRELGYSA